MKVKRIVSEIRTIQLGYEEEKPLSEYETQIIARYIEIHSLHAGFERSMQEHIDRIDTMTQSTNASRQKLDRIKKLLNELLSDAGVLISPEENPEDRVKKLQAQTDNYNSAVRGFHDELCAANESWNQICQKFNTFYDGWDTRFETQLEEFNDFIDKLYTNYEEYQLDTNTFWDDHEQFKECLQETEKKMNTLYNKLEDALENWESLATSANLFYDFIKNQDSFRNIHSPDMLN